MTSIQIHYGSFHVVEAPASAIQFRTAPFASACAKRFHNYTDFKTLGGALSYLARIGYAADNPATVEVVVRMPDTGRFAVAVHTHRPDRCDVQPAVLPDQVYVR